MSIVGNLNWNHPSLLHQPYRQTFNMKNYTKNKVQPMRQSKWLFFIIKYRQPKCHRSCILYKLYSDSTLSNIQEVKSNGMRPFNSFVRSINNTFSDLSAYAVHPTVGVSHAAKLRAWMEAKITPILCIPFCVSMQFLKQIIPSRVRSILYRNVCCLYSICL